MRRIIVLNQKGGVGKTTTVANLGACLAELGKKVLMVDVDPQANLSLHFGVEVPRGEPSLYTLLQGENGPEEVLCTTSVDGLHLLPGNVDMAGLAVELPKERSSLFVLRDVLQGVWNGYDYVLTDSPPSLGMLTLNAMCASQEIFITLQTEFFALQGVGKLIQTVHKVQTLNPGVDVTGVVACMYDARTCLAKEILAEIRKHFGRRVFDTVVRTNIRLAEAPGFGLPITQYDESCHGADDYRSLAAEVVAMQK